MDNWISVKDRLPEKTMKCLCFIKNEFTSYISICEFSKGLKKFDTDIMFAHRFMPDRVTHWQPLPEPPKGE